MKINAHEIKLIMANQELSASKLAERCGVSRQSISTILTRGTCEPKTAGKLAKGLNVEVGKIVKEE